ncbi:hypothetical protein VKT23_020195 [Stygiomarasmius scandens]|uniref:EF-hand domain-containing protein n=1 Tax=Marasmiellus scandens TaxID=2682957 RepID=A0ABR1IJI4_9AGAR
MSQSQWPPSSSSSSQPLQVPTSYPPFDFFRAYLGDYDQKKDAILNELNLLTERAYSKRRTERRLYTLLGKHLSRFGNSFIEKEGSYTLIMQESFVVWYIDANGKKKKIECFPDYMTQFLTSLRADLKDIIEVKPLDPKPSKGKQHSLRNDGTDIRSDVGSSSKDDTASSSALSALTSSDSDNETAEATANSSPSDSDDGTAEATVTMSMELWHGPDATTAVRKMLRKSFKQLFTQALFAFHSFPEKESVRIKFYCGWYLIVLLFNRPPSTMFSYEDLDKDGELSAEKLVELFPHEVIVDGVPTAAGFQPTFKLPLTNMFTFDVQGTITGFKEAYLDTFRETIVEVVPNTHSFELQPLFESLRLANSGKEEDDKLENFKIFLESDLRDWYRFHGSQIPAQDGDEDPAIAEHRAEELLKLEQPKPSPPPSAFKPQCTSRRPPLVSPTPMRSTRSNRPKRPLAADFDADNESEKESDAPTTKLRKTK